MITFKNKKELLDFINNQDDYIIQFIEILNENGIEGDYDKLIEKVDLIQNFLENSVANFSIEKQDVFRLGFWAFFSKLLMEQLGGELKIASPSDYSAGTPQLINYGRRFDKKGKRKWIGIAFDSWFESHLTKNNLVSLNGKIKKLIEDYS